MSLGAPVARYSRAPALQRSEMSSPAAFSCAAPPRPPAKYSHAPVARNPDDAPGDGIMNDAASTRLIQQSSREALLRPFPRARAATSLALLPYERKQDERRRQEQFGASRRSVPVGVDRGRLLCRRDAQGGHMSGTQRRVGRLAPLSSDTKSALDGRHKRPKATSPSRGYELAAAMGYPVVSAPETLSAPPDVMEGPPATASDEGPVDVKSDPDVTTSAAGNSPVVLGHVFAAVAAAEHDTPEGCDEATSDRLRRYDPDDDENVIAFQQRFTNAIPEFESPCDLPPLPPRQTAPLHRRAKELAAARANFKRLVGGGDESRSDAAAPSSKRLRNSVLLRSVVDPDVQVGMREDEKKKRRRPKHSGAEPVASFGQLCVRCMSGAAPAPESESSTARNGVAVCIGTAADMASTVNAALLALLPQLGLCVVCCCGREASMQALHALEGACGTAVVLMLGAARRDGGDVVLVEHDVSLSQVEATLQRIPSDRCACVLAEVLIDSEAACLESFVLAPNASLDARARLQVSTTGRQRGTAMYYVAKALEGSVKIPSVPAVCLYVDHKLGRRVLPDTVATCEVSEGALEAAAPLVPTTDLLVRGEAAYKVLAAARRSRFVTCVVDVGLGVIARRAPQAVLCRAMARLRTNVFGGGDAMARSAAIVSSIGKRELFDLRFSGTVSFQFEGAAPPLETARAAVRAVCAHACAIACHEHRDEVLQSADAAAMQLTAYDTIVFTCAPRQPRVHTAQVPATPEQSDDDAETAQKTRTAAFPVFCFGEANVRDAWVAVLSHFANAATGALDPPCGHGDASLLSGVIVREGATAAFQGSEHNVLRLLKHSCFGSLDIASLGFLQVKQIRGLRPAEATYESDAAVVVQAWWRRLLALRYIRPRISYAADAVRQYGRIVHSAIDACRRFMHRLFSEFQAEAWAALEVAEAGARDELTSAVSHERDVFTAMRIVEWNELEATVRGSVEAEWLSTVLMEERRLHANSTVATAARHSDFIIHVARFLAREYKERQHLLASDYGGRCGLREAARADVAKVRDAAERRERMRKALAERKSGAFSISTRPTRALVKPASEDGSTSDDD